MGPAPVLAGDGVLAAIGQLGGLHEPRFAQDAEVLGGMSDSLWTAVVGIVRAAAPAEVGAGPSRKKDGSRKAAAAPLSLGGRARG